MICNLFVNNILYQNNVCFDFDFALSISRSFSCFCISNKCVDSIGLFDENFHPAYFEDCDYARRFLLKDREITKIHNCDYIHDHSTTMKKYNHEQLQEHHARFAANKLYYIHKWGGEPHQEIYNNPFNLSEVSK